MLACVDVQYRDDQAAAACALFHSWCDEKVAEHYVAHVSPIEPYVPGEFYRRELPCILAAIEPFRAVLEVVVIDGYVWLADVHAPGLGARLYEALDRRIPVIGVAKTEFAGVSVAAQVLRGTGHRPLFVTAVGLDVEVAADFIRQMHGPFRIPTLLKYVDQLCRRLSAGDTL